MAISTPEPEDVRDDEGAGRAYRETVHGGVVLRSPNLVDHFRAMLTGAPQERTYRFLVDGENEQVSLTNAELDRWVRAVAVTLRQQAAEGDRALIICPPGLDYLASFLACLYARVVAVPVYPPDPVLLKRTLPRLLGVIADARPAVVLAPASIVAMAAQIAELVPELGSLRWQAVDQIERTAADAWQRPALDGEDIAFLQYTSGSTGRPKGVMLSHTNLLANLEVTRERFVGDATETHVVSWLPPYHDMGLIGALLQPLYSGFGATFMSPVAFLKRPGRWLRAISTYRATLAGAPNFAYDLCINKVSAQEREGLDLSAWRLAFSGAEPVRAETIERFSREFAPYGFRRSAFYPCYGLAEATLFVSGAAEETEPVLLRVRADALAEHRVVPAGEDPDAEDTSAEDTSAETRMLVGCGTPATAHEVAIVDPETGQRVPGDQVGEIWVAGPSIARGYWERPEESEKTFAARLAGTGEGPFLRTGDLGFLRGGELFVTGRAKDVIIIAGRNHYPQDIEATVERADPALRAGGGAACSVDVDDEERLVVIQEVAGSPKSLDPQRAIAAIRAAVAEEHGIQVHDVVLIKKGGILKTSSGKLQRSACRKAFLEGTLPTVESWSASVPPDAGAASAPDGSADPAAGEAQTPAGEVETPAGATGSPAADQERAARRTEIERWLTRELAERLKVAPEIVDPTQPIAGHGLQSVELVGLVGELERWLGRPLSATLTWEYPTIDALADFLAGHDAAQQAGSDDVQRPAEGATRIRERDGAPANGQADGGPAEPVAIIGIGCRFPGGAQSPGAFWDLLREGRDAITEVPADRWDAAAYLDEDPSVPGKTTTAWGGFLDGVEGFDPHFFGISAHEAARMDPQQRLLAEVTWEALEDAGVVPERLAGSATGVFVGIATNDYGQYTLQDLTRVDAYTGTGNAFSIAANRLSYLLDLRGPSIAIDSACSSSLVAVHQACVSLAAGDCTLAVAGGVNVVLSPALAINFSKAGAMARDGRCKVFDARADGYVRSEGAGVVVLKPLSRAIADGDPIYAVIRGGAVNQDGRTNGLMAPNPHAQEAVLRTAYARAGVRPEQVGYVEAHGTGTLLGDPIEAKALAAVVGAGRDPGRPCLIGSVKSNVGHLEAAAGIAGLVKTALVLRHRTIPPSLHFQRPNPHIPFAELALRVADTLQPWPAADDDGPAVAGVSSFGFGGTNAHLVLAEPLAGSAAPPQGATGPQVLTISARTEEALRDLADRYARRLTDPDVATDPAALCAAAAVRRSHHEYRLACVGDTAERMREALAAYRKGEEFAGLSSGGRRVGRRPRVAFVFSGQGPRWWPLAQDLLDGEPVFRTALDRCDAALREHTDWSLLAEITADAGQSRLTDPAVAQPALCAVQIALAELWRSWGIEPAAVVGHSVGEVAAAQVAGVLSLSDALRVAWHRGRVIRSVTGQGRMAVVGLPLGQAEALLAERRPRGVSVAASNGPSSTVVSGDAEAVRALAEALPDEGIFCRLLESVEFASHSPLMEPLQAELRDSLDGLTARPPLIAMLSTVTGRLVDGASLDAGYWAANLREPVLFDPAVTALLEAGHDTFVEISPHPMLGEPIGERMSLEQREGVVVASLRRDEPGRAALLAELGRLYTAGFGVDWGRRYDRPVPMVPLPAYPWQRQRHWIDDEFGRPRRSGWSGHPALETFVRSAAEPRAYHWNAHVDLAGLPYLGDHRVAGTPVLPAALLLDAGLAAARQVLTEADTVLEDVRLTRLTVVDELAEEPTLQLRLQPQTGGMGSVQVFSRRAAEPDGWTEVAQGRYRTRATAGGAAVTANGATAPAGEPLAEVRARCARSVDTAEHYARLEAAGLQYGTAFRRIEELWQGGQEAVARLSPPVTADRSAYLVHPALLDGCLQVLAAVLADGGPTGTYLPVGVDRFTVDAERAAPEWAHAVLGVADADSGEISGCRVVLYAADGTRAGEIDGIALRRLDDPATADPVADSLLGLRWQEVVEETPSAAPADAGWWLLLADRGGVAESLRTELISRGGRCVSVLAGARYARTGDGRYEVDPSRPEDLTALLAQVRADETTRCAGVIQAWGLDAELTDDAGPDALERVGDLGPVATLHLVQALAGAGVEPAPRLVLVTRGAQVVGDETGVPAVAQAALWGLARVVNLEHGELRPTIVDLDPAETGGAATGLTEEVLRRDGTEQVALRGGRRYVPRLAPWQAPTEPEQAEPGQAEPGQADRSRPFDPEHDGNLRILATHPGILGSLSPVLWERTPPGPGQVQIEVTAAGLNFSDVLKAMEICPGVPKGIVPLGAECAGRVSAVGEGVTGLRVGDEVMAVAPSSMAAYATTTAELVARRPAGLGVEEAAAIPIAFLTAVYGLEYLAHLGPGDTVLIHSASGGVGLAALQVARRNGAEVFATAGTEEKRELLRGLGVRHVMDSRSLRFADEVRELTGGRGVDVVLNSLVGEALLCGLSLLAPNGRFVEIGKQDVYANSHVGLEALKHNRSFFAVDLERCFAERPALIARLWEQVLRGFDAGEFTALPVTTFGYAQADEAFTYMAQARHTGKIVLRPDGRERVVGPPVRADRTYLITGGLGALGLRTARHLVEQGARRLVLLGRSGPSERAAEVIGELRAAGAVVEVRQVDISRYDGVAALVGEIDASMPPLAGVVHAAGLLDDGLLVQLTRDRFRAVGAPKADGAWNLHRAVGDRKLDFFVLYSSAAALLGSPGQGNYAAANAFLDALALHRRARGLSALSIDWGPWAEEGLAARPDRAGALAGRGIESIRPEHGITALDRLLRTSTAQAAVLPLDRAKLRDAAESGLLPALLADLLGPSSAGTGGRKQSGEVRRRLLSVEPGRRRRNLLVAHCAGEVARILKLDVSLVDPTAPLAGMGFDSLMSLELRKRLEVGLGVDLPATVVWRFPTIDALAPYLAERMDVVLEAEPTGTAGDTVTDASGLETPADDVDQELAELSDDEVEALLLARITQFDEGSQV